MLGWSIPLFRIRGIQLSLHGSFLLLLGYVAWSGWDEGRTAGMLWTAATFLAFFGCVVLHELGHSLTAMRFGIGVRRILLMPIGGMAEFDGIPRKPSRELWMTVAGPAVNFVIAAVLWLVVHRMPDAVPLYSFDGMLLQLYWANLIMGTFNLLPAFPMDGGRILRALLAMRFNYLTATRVAAWTGKILCVAGVIAALEAPVIGRWLGEDVKPLWVLAVLFAFIFIVGEMEYRAVERRECDEAHWRATLARLERGSAGRLVVTPGGEGAAGPGGAGSGEPPSLLR